LVNVARLHLDVDLPCIALNAADEKNREGNVIMLRDDLANDLRQWLAAELERLQGEAREHGDLIPIEQGEPIPAQLPADRPLFRVPAGLLRILDRDLKAAGIAKVDERGRTLDVHALRTTFGTLLSKGGVAPRTAQAAMRHSDIRLTMQTYTDPKLLDVRGALDALPALPLTYGQPEAAKATGTVAFRFAPGFAPTHDKSVLKQSIAVKTAEGERDAEEGAKIAATSEIDKGNEPLTSAVKRVDERTRTADFLIHSQAL